MMNVVAIQKASVACDGNFKAVCTNGASNALE